MATGFKTGGRIKGTPNKKTTDIQQLLENLNCNPIEGMARIAENIEIDIGIRLNAYKELAQYMFPKRRAVDLNASVNVLSHEDALLYLEADY
jgi:hypothetical protein